MILFVFCILSIGISTRNTFSTIYIGISSSFSISICFRISTRTSIGIRISNGIIVLIVILIVESLTLLQALKQEPAPPAKAEFPKKARLMA